MVYNNQQYMNPDAPTNRSAYIHYDGGFPILKKIAETQPVVFDVHDVRFRYSIVTLASAFPRDIMNMYAGVSEFFTMFHVTAVMHDGMETVISVDHWRPINFLNIAYFKIEDNPGFLNELDENTEELSYPIYHLVRGKVKHRETGVTHETCGNCGLYGPVNDFSYIEPIKNSLINCLRHIKMHHFNIPLCYKCIEMNYIITEQAFVPLTKRRTTMRKSAKR